MENESPKDRALYLLSLLMIFFANFILLPCAFFLVVLTGAAIFDKNFLLAVVFFFAAILCVLINRVIIKADDRWEEKKAKEKEEFRQSQIKKIEVASKSGRSGRLEFNYDPEDETMKVSRKQLRPFNNDSGFEVISYGSGGQLNCEVEIIDQIYRDEEELINGMRKALLAFFQNEGENVKESDVHRINITELTIEKEKDGYYIHLSGEPEKYSNFEVYASKIFGPDNYFYGVYRI